MANSLLNTLLKIFYKIFHRLKSVMGQTVPVVPTYPHYSPAPNGFSLSESFRKPFVLMSHEKIIIAHRGASIEERENSLAAILAASKLGAAMCEIDVRLSADGAPVLTHDEDVINSDGRGFPINECQAARLEEMGICTLEKALTLAPKMAYLLDLKEEGRDLIEKVVQVIENTGSQDRILFIGKYAYLDQDRLWKIPRASISDRLKPGDIRGRKLIDAAKSDGHLVYAVLKEKDLERSKLLWDLGVNAVMAADVRKLCVLRDIG